MWLVDWLLLGICILWVSAAATISSDAVGRFLKLASKVRWLVVCGVALLCLLVTRFTWPVHEKLLSGDWAAWVQAIGSILAIIGSFAVANRQHKHEVRDRKEAEKGRRITIAQQITHVASYAEWPRAEDIVEFSTEQKLQKAKELDVETQEQYLRMFESFQVFEARNTMPVTVVLNMIANWRKGIRIMKRANELALKDDSSWEAAFDDLVAHRSQSEIVRVRMQRHENSIRDGTLPVD